MTAHLTSWANYATGKEAKVPQMKGIFESAHSFGISLILLRSTGKNPFILRELTVSLNAKAQGIATLFGHARLKHYSNCYLACKNEA